MILAAAVKEYLSVLVQTFALLAAVSFLHAKNGHLKKYESLLSLFLKEKNVSKLVRNAVV